LLENYDAGKTMFELMEKLFPICRSITGNGVRETLKILSGYISLETHEVKTGTKVFDWNVPMEWNIKDAYIKSNKGEKIIDFKNSNLHVLGYSIPINESVKLDELKKHMYTIPEQPDIIPYKTSYYNKNWGFCLTHKQFSELNDESYDVCIDSELKDGSLTYGEYFIKGKSTKEILFSSYVCHPSICNDALSGVVMNILLAKTLLKHQNELNYSYRFLFVPETVGAITWLSINEEKTKNISHGLVLTCVGDNGNFTYKKTRDGDSEIDKTVLKILKKSEQKFHVKDFFPTGSDERQFCSPGFNLPVGSLMRTMYGEFKEYHTSSDNLSFVNIESLQGSFDKFVEIIKELENNFGNFQETKTLSYEKTSSNDIKFLNLNPKCELQLGKRGLYHKIGGPKSGVKPNIKGMLWLLNLSDGNHTLSQISKRSKISEDELIKYADILIEQRLLKKIV
jgi:aminopeptidase-like protein